jgi:O-acetyl-ADP-ribose deacetylase (regulator of RNase III)
MIKLAQGDILKTDAEALVNTVNTVGIMGRGIALQFRKAFPENFKAYEAACQADQVQPGRMFVYDLNRLYNPRFIINFPTKRHWKSKSRIDDIQSGLVDLIHVVQ